METEKTKWSNTIGYFIFPWRDNTCFSFIHFIHEKKRLFKRSKEENNKFMQAKADINIMYSGMAY